MPHLVLLYTADLEADVPMDTLCRELADAMLEQRDETGKAVFPTGGTRVLAYPAAHSAVADGQGNYGFLYANLRMGAGRSKVVHQSVGKALSAVLARHTEAARARRAIGVTLQIDESTSQVFDAKHSSLHPLFNKNT
ncbi:5-carboxymethyl-2-hydroxymuconate isomerase [Pseudomonas stutzeri]|uniref:5-carboxymethyl-2-hydroxymuconate isomerase n=1 Tax=Stutzerimonas stutzeri KOS6 TaxID=1218352 RepID=A0A061JVI9_STUST|nr:5-carboxymethyl-2-hydroxymuconate Delta-isomerase [Stutzerimonas stutzeri]EWC42439.1 5-carboxymethyl-2-hydroxymuconate isomerase [Stutzerimonas stutzeri KOS6]MBK3870228.1 5-carboxymethyl-2-hydroxymuconate isomerase [Stutzerimonas stutzeri]